MTSNSIKRVGFGFLLCLSGCMKYEKGPILSLQPVETRLEREWEEFVFDYKTREYTGSEIIRREHGQEVERIRYELVDNKETIRLWLNDTQYFDEPILRLTSSDLIIQFDDEHIHYKAHKN